MTRTAPDTTPLPWFRLYSEFASDPKVQMLSEAMQRRFVMLLCLTCSRTVPTSNDAVVEFALRISGDELRETKRVLLDCDLIREDWFPVAWHKRQRRSDNAAERKRRQRERDTSRDVSRDNSGTVTPRAEQSRTEQIRTDKVEPERSTASSSILVTHEQREARALRQLMQRRSAIGIATFRDPLPGESASAYRAAQDEAWTKLQESRKATQ